MRFLGAKLSGYIGLSNDKFEMISDKICFFEKRVDI